MGKRGHVVGVMTKAPKGTRAIGYVRVSTEQQADDGVSLDAQQAKLKAYAFAMDVELVDIIVDAGASAKTLQRPGLSQALARLDVGEADALLVPKLDRLTRSVRDLGTLIDRYFGADGKAALLSVADSIDTRSAGGRLVLNVLTSVSQWEREAIGERTSTALQHMKKTQGAKLGRVGLGWKRSKATDEHGRRKLVRDAKGQAAVRRIYALADDGLSLRAIAAQLTDEGVPTKRGGRWQANTIAKVLHRRQGKTKQASAAA